jgi:5-methylcytosine-specific restriction endonuclease McrA
VSKPLSWKPKPPRLLRLPKISREVVKRAGVGADEWARISADTRLFVWTRDQGRCRSCGSTQNLQFDHVIPRAWGGSGSAENVEMLCRDCNLKKGARLNTPHHAPED